MAAGDVYRISVFGTQASHQMMNVFHVRCITAPDPTVATLQVVADGFKEAVRPSQDVLAVWKNWRAVQVFGPNVDYSAKPCQRIGGQVFEANLSGTLAGGQSGSEPLPPQCAATVTLASGLVGRRHRGRTYVWGISELQQNNGAFVGSFITTLTTNFGVFHNKYKIDGTDPNYQYGVWSDRTAFGCEYVGKPPVHTQVDPPDPDNAFTPIRSFTPKSVVNTQRRRAVGVGR